MNISGNRRAFFFAYFIPLALTAIVYIGSLDTPFQFDDKKALLYTDKLHDLGNIRDILLFDRALPRPLFHFSLALDWRIWGPMPMGFHLTNIILHLVVTALLIGIFRFLFKQSIFWPSFCAAIFAVHPAITESVTYIWSRSSVLSAVFWNLALYLYIRSMENQRKPLAYILSIITFILALLAKEIAATLPLIILCMEIKQQRREENDRFAFDLRRLFRVFPYFLIVLSEIICRKIIYGKVLFTSSESYFSHLTRQMVVVPSYLLKCLWPVNLSVDNYVPESHAIHIVILAFLFVILYAYFSIRYLRHSLAAFGLLWFLICLLPFIAIPLDDKMVERNLYFPMMGFAIFLSESVKNAINANKRLSILLATSVIICYFILSNYRNIDWKTEENLWQDAIRKSPEKARPYNYLGALHLERENIKKATWLIDCAIRRDSEYAEARNNRGVLAMNMGDYKRAAYEFAVARTNSPDLLEAAINYAKAEFMMGNYDRSKQILIKLIEENKIKVTAMSMLAEIYRIEGNHLEAKKIYEMILSISPNSYEAFVGIAMTENINGNTENAIKYTMSALKMDPSRAEAHRVMADIYITRGDWDNAIAELNELLKNYPNDIELLSDLGIAYMKTKNYEKAQKIFIKEMQLAEGDPKPLLQLATIEELSGNTENAIKLYNRALMLDKKGRYSPDIKDILKRLNEKKKEEESKKRNVH